MQKNFLLRSELHYNQVHKVILSPEVETAKIIRGKKKFFQSSLKLPTKELSIEDGHLTKMIVSEKGDDDIEGISVH